MRSFDDDRKPCLRVVKKRLGRRRAIGTQRQFPGRLKFTVGMDKGVSADTLQLGSWQTGLAAALKNLCRYERWFRLKVEGCNYLPAALNDYR